MVAAIGESTVSNDVSPLKKYVIETPLDDKDNRSSSSLNTEKSSWRQKWQNIINNITVEPIVAAYIMPSVLSNLATQNLNLEKACRVNMKYGDDICDALTRRDTKNYTM